MAGGRPTNHSEELEEQAWEYIKNFREHGHTVPSVVGLCKVINRSKSIVYDWAKNKIGQFSDIIESIAESQEIELCNNGLKGDFNSTITKLMLTKHGYSDKQEIDQDTRLIVEIQEFKQDGSD